MQISTLDILICPQCRALLTFNKSVNDDFIANGELSCAHCGKIYPIDEGILHLIPKREVAATYPQMEEQARKGARFYDLLLNQFLEILDISPNDARAEYMERLELTPKAKILDIGVGTGAELSYLWPKTKSAELYGLDISIEMLRQCQRKVEKIKAHIELFLGFAERLPFKDNTFDVVFHTGSINEFRDQQTAIYEMIRVAKAGTLIVIADEWLTAENTRQTIGRQLVEAFPSLPRDVIPPIEYIPAKMEEKKVDTIWRGYGYCLQFRKPKY